MMLESAECHWAGVGRNETAAARAFQAIIIIHIITIISIITALEVSRGDVAHLC